MLAAVIGIFLSVLLSLFIPSVQSGLRDWLRKRPQRIFLVPTVLTVLFGGVLASANAWNAPFQALAAAYTFLPTFLVFDARRRGLALPSWQEFAAVLLLWLPIEFAAGSQWLPRGVRGPIALTAHGSAVTLGLCLFLVFRGWQGMKYNLPKRLADFLYPAVAFVLVAPVLIWLGLRLGFLGPFQIPAPLRLGAFLVLFLKILGAVAIPEELLFRALIQNWIMQKLGENYGSLLLAAVIFGAAHLDNPPGPPPNWRYMILATIAGFAYGRVFWKSSSILSSASLHAFVNALRHTLFR